jgi:hypothetical protein
MSYVYKEIAHSTVSPAPADQVVEQLKAVRDLESRRAREELEARIIGELANAIYSILVVEEPDPAAQAQNRVKVTEAARAAFRQFNADQLV